MKLGKAEGVVFGIGPIEFQSREYAGLGPVIGFKAPVHNKTYETCAKTLVTKMIIMIGPIEDLPTFFS